MKREFTVALCDTQRSDAEACSGIIKEWLADSDNAGARLSVFADISEVREKLADGFGADIYIVGISSHSAGGIELARIIRLRQPDVPLIFIAGTKNFAYEAYELHALRYIPRPVQRDELVSALELADLLCRTLPANTVSVRMTGETRNINSDDVVFVENNVRSMRYVLRDGSSLTGTRRNVSFEEYFAPLLQSGRFVQTHKSFIINLRYIRAVKSTSVVMTNGVQVPISRRHVSEVQEAYRVFGTR